MVFCDESPSQRDKQSIHIFHTFLPCMRQLVAYTGEIFGYSGCCHKLYSDSAIVRLYSDKISFYQFRHKDDSVWLDDDCI